MTQEFHISVTPVGSDEYLVRTERVAPGVPLAEEQFIWTVDSWLEQARYLMHDPLLGILRGYGDNRIGGFELPNGANFAEAKESHSQPPLTLVELGQQLYGALFQGTLRDSWMTAQGIAQHRGEVLRLRLGLKGHRLPRLPWEVMHRGEATADNSRRHGGLVPAPRPIASGTDIVFSRYQPGTHLVGAATALAVESEQPLRMLMAIAAPTDQERLELKREATLLQQELRRQNGAIPEGYSRNLPDIQVTILEQPGCEELTQALEQGQYHIFHFAGHSNLGALGGALYLVNRKTGLTEVLSGDDLAGLLVNNGIRLAMFNSCRGAYTAASDPESEQPERNLAEALVSRGIPAVLAMAEQIPDDVAITLTRLFYRNFKQGYPIDLSLSRARQGLMSSYGSHQFYWALPILYLHPDFDGYLTWGDRSFNPADRLLLLPQVYDATLSGEEPPASDDATTTQAIDSHEDWQLLAAVLQDEPDSAPASNNSETPDADPLLEDDLGYDEDAAVVADLIRQLSPPVLNSPEADDFLPALPTEVLLSETEASGLEMYDNLPENPIYRQSTPETPAVSAEEAVQAIASLTPTVRPSEAEAVKPQAEPIPAESASSTVPSGQEKRKFPTPRPLVMVGIVGTIASVALGFWLFPRLVVGQRSPDTLLPSIAVESPSLTSSPVDLKTANPATVTAIAIAHFNRNDLATAQEAVAALLDNGSLQEAQTALQSVPEDNIDDPAISFLRGRLAWESIKRGNNDFSIDDARRYWETAVREQPDVAQYHTALGFALYAEGNSKLAIASWCRALSLLEPSVAASDSADNANCPLPATNTSDPEALTAAAGIALALQQDSRSTQSLSEAGSAASKATKLYEMVLSSDPLNFQPDRLAATNWLWTDDAIGDWRALGSQTP